MPRKQQDRPKLSRMPQRRDRKRKKKQLKN
jgi:hypothetical protein